MARSRGPISKIYRPVNLNKDFFCMYCEKRGHLTYGRAIKVALRCSTKRGNDGLRIYYCRESKSYHTTSMRSFL